MHTRGNIITDNNSKMEDVILKGKRNLKKLTEENKKEAKGSIKSIKTKEQEEIERLMDSVIYKNKKALNELAE